MDTRTGKIDYFENMEEAKKAGFNAELSEVEAKILKEHQEEERTKKLREMRMDQLSALREPNPYAKKKRTQKNRQKLRMKGAKAR